MKNKLERFVRGMGLDVFGTSNAQGHVPERFGCTPYAITMGIRLSDSVMTGGGNRAYEAIFSPLPHSQRLS